MRDITVLLKTCGPYVRLQDSQNICEIKSFQSELENSRIQELDKLVQILTEICKTLENLKTEVFKCSISANFDKENLRRKLMGLEEKLIDTKQDIKDELAEMAEDELKLSKDIKFLEKRMVDWSKTAPPQLFKPPKQSAYRVQDQMNNPTHEFQKFLQSSGGHCGGWLEHDHLIFLRERRKFKKKDKFLEAVHNCLPDLSLDVISEHELWYLKYEQLRSAQKEAIFKWKAHKLERQEECTTNNVSEEKNYSTQKKKAVNQINIAERIKEWKKQQMEKKQEEQERLKEQERQRQQQQEKIKMIQRQKKQAVMEYKAEKLRKMISDELLGKEKKSHALGKTRSNMLLKSFRLQDIKFIEKKKIIKLQLETKAASKIESLRLTKSPFDFLLQRDPKRIFKPTLIWTQHCQPKDERKDTFVANVLNLNTIPRLAIPEWRRELK
ncbi:hypothetical protein RUM44_005640 [Polyplax serrata]|uniref:Coiled-coil domain-containing protein 112 n=1 Tax=Polyplax serrata TaxID=468196 RepID=A0ABR1ADY7_POLSC